MITRTASIVLVALSLVAVPVAAVGADDSELFAVIGVGAGSCGEWTNERGTPLGYGTNMEGWLLGFVTAHNMNLPKDAGAFRNLAENTDYLGLFAWMDNYCEEHPMELIYEAAMSIVAELGTQWSAAHPPQ